MKNYKFILGLMLGLTFFLFMGAFTRDWIESTPTNSTVANQIDDFNRYLRVDVSDRLKSQVYGLTNGENTGNPGFKKQIFLQQSSAEGAPNANEIVFYSIDDGSNCSYYAIQEDGYIKQILKKVGSDLNFVIETADIPADLIDSVHYAANSIDPEHLVDDFTFDTFPLSPSSAPDADYELANKKYVDDNLTAAGKVEVDDSTVFNTTMTSGNTFQDLDLSAKVGSNVAWVYLEIVSTGGGSYACKPKGEGSGTFSNHIEAGNLGGGGASSARLQNGNYRYLLCQTDSSGIISHGYTDNSDTLTIKLLTFIK